MRRLPLTFCFAFLFTCIVTINWFVRLFPRHSFTFIFLYFLLRFKSEESPKELAKLGPDCDEDQNELEKRFSVRKEILNRFCSKMPKRDMLSREERKFFLAEHFHYPEANILFCRLVVLF